jgi:ParB-like chromosome segregation protein Spo0J
MKLSDRVKNNAGFNAGQICCGRMARTEDIAEDPEISGIFKIHDNTLESVTESMRENGFDRAEPIVVWKGNNSVVDGHTRLKAARTLGMEEVPVIEKEFEDVYAAILYTFERQANRRNLEQGEILAVASTLRDKAREARDGSGRGAELLAKKLGVSAATIYKARRIGIEASEEDLKAVQEGRTTINKVYKKIERKERAQKETEKKERSPEEDGGAAEIAGNLSNRASFVLEAAELLVERGETDAAAIIVKHFIPKREIKSFCELLPDGARKGLELEF